MNNDNETRKKLLLCAKKEFLEKGYAKASLRHICSEADVTTGAVYFFFKDKEGLFEAIVGEPLQKLMAAIMEHFSSDRTEDFTTYVHKPGDHDDFAESLINILYEDREVVMLLLTRASGSKYENIIDQMIGMVDQNFGGLADKYAKAKKAKVNKYMSHWLSHLSVMSFIHLVTHVESKEAALKYIKPMLEHIVMGWMNYALEK